MCLRPSDSFPLSPPCHAFAGPPFLLWIPIGALGTLCTCCEGQENWLFEALHGVMGTILAWKASCHNRRQQVWAVPHLVAHDCGYPLSHYTCRATRVATDFLDFIAFCRCSTGVALHPLKILVSHLPPPPVPGGVAPKFGSEKVSRHTGVSQLQLRVSRYTVQLRLYSSY